MPVARVPRDLNAGTYFLTLTIQRWYYIFDRHNRWDILAHSIRHCQAHKNLEVFGYVFMLNHIHVIARAPDVGGFLRDFKRHTSRSLQRNLARHEPAVLELFTSDDGSCKFWKMSNAPRAIENEEFYIQKLRYIHFNPVRKGYVERPEYWKWSSANPESPIALSDPWHER